MLTTRCPHCSTVFRIKPEQLSVRGGRVRCGHCQQPFSALAHLEELDDETPLSPPAPRQSASPAAAVVAPAAPVPAPAPVSTPAPAPVPIFPAALDPRPEPVVSSIPAMTASLHAKPWPVPEADLPAPAFSAVAATQTLILPESAPAAAEAPAVGDDFSMNIRLDGPSPAEVRGELGGELDFDFAEIDDEKPAVADLTPTPTPVAYTSQIARDLGVPAYDPEQALVFGQTVMLEEPIEIAGIPDPEFDHGPESLYAERERQLHPAGQVEDRRRSHAGLWLWLLGVLLLMLLATVQLAYVFRTDLTRWLPESRPLLEEACVVLGCDVPYPQIIADDLIVIESSGFTPDASQEGRFRLVASILNKANFHQAWPHLELTITDRFDIAIARRVLKPAEWLPPAYASLPAFEAHSEVTANLSLDLGKLPASGYRLYVFYP